MESRHVQVCVRHHPKLVCFLRHLPQTRTFIIYFRSEDLYSLQHSYSKSLSNKTFYKFWKLKSWSNSSIEKRRNGVYQDYKRFDKSARHYVNIKMEWDLQWFDKTTHMTICILKSLYLVGIVTILYCTMNNDVIW